jgi:hypothetical protein
MNISQHLSGSRRLFSGVPAGAAFLALVLFASLTPSTAHAQRFGRGFGRGFGGGLGWGLGFGLGSALVYDSYYYAPPPVVYTADAPTVYYIPQPAAPQTVVVNPAPAPVAAPAAPVAAAPAASNAGKMMSKIVYDANGKPLGVIILSPDGSQQFVPLAQ